MSAMDPAADWGSMPSVPAVGAERRSDWDVALGRPRRIVIGCRAEARPGAEFVEDCARGRRTS